MKKKGPTMDGMKYLKGDAVCLDLLLSGIA